MYNRITLPRNCLELNKNYPLNLSYVHWRLYEPFTYVFVVVAVTKIVRS